MIRGMTRLAGCRARLGQELPRVRVLMACPAFRWSALEHYVGQLSPRPRLVTLVALHCGVCAEKRKRSLGMVEARQVRPGFQGMARFTAGHASVWTPLRHALAKFPVMRIGMTARAAAILEVIRNHLRCADRFTRHMALRTCHCQVRRD